jgi:CheY-like chemotaxis protein/two-component sensor histidine kinase
VRLAESEEALRRASKAKDEFLGVVSHELRNPLGAMAGALRLLRLHRSLEDPAARRAIEIADRQVRQQSRLVDDLLDVTRLATSNILLDIQSLDLGDLLARAVADTRAAASERRHVVSYERPREPIIVEGDAMRLSQIVSNLILNSIKYTPDGGHIDVGLRREGGAAVISVRDDGAGIPEGLLDEVFSPFFQQRAGESASKGLGLGLTIAQRLVALHGGRISASSEGVGHGSEFTVRLPLSERSAASRDESLASVTHSEPPVSGRPITAVVVDDMEDGREILGLLLESLGVAVRDAGTGEEGLGLVHAERPDLMLIDIDLPDMTGLEVARRARRACGDGTLLVAVTGYGAQEDRERAVEAGFDEYLVKPVDVNRLAELVDVLSKRPSAAASAE